MRTNMTSLPRLLTPSPRQRHITARAPHSPTKYLLLYYFFPHSTVAQQSNRTRSWPNLIPRNPTTMATLTPPLPQDDAEFGFSRPEMSSAKLAGTVDAYDRHVFLCYKSPEDWLPRVEDSDKDQLLKVLSSAVKARKNDIAVKTKVTICRGGEGQDGDVLVFPDMIKYKGLTEPAVDGFVDDVLVNGKLWASGIQEVLTGSHVFVCAHGSRDKRCGVCGPPLIEKLMKEIKLRGLDNQISVSPCSHVGGHKYAGNVIIYSPGPMGKITGHWYGYVTPDDVPELIDQHIGQGQVIERLWRGQMGATIDKTEEAKILNGEHVKKPKKRQEVTVEVKMENISGCCQGPNGTSCCRDGTLENSTSGKEKNGTSKFSCWSGKWEQHNVLTAIAIVGAVATVAVAYAFYRRSH